MRRHVPILVRHRDRISDAEGQTQEQAGARASIGVNRSMFQPHWKKILERYLLKFSKGGKVHADDLGLIDPAAVNDSGHYARWGEPAPHNRGEHAGMHIG